MSVDTYEQLAEQFERETGMMAPGKDAPAGLGGPDYITRSTVWNRWLRERAAVPLERVTPESLAAQVFERGEPITPEQLHALFDDVDSEKRDAQRYRAIRAHSTALTVKTEAGSTIRIWFKRGDKRIGLGEHLDTLADSLSTPATTAAPGAADDNEVHGDNA